MIGNELLRGSLVRLDALEREDMKVVAPWWRSLEFTQYLSQGAIFPLTEEDEDEWYTTMRKDSGKYLFAIRPLDSEAPVGTCSLFDFNWRIRKCLFGIAIGDPACRGRGYGTDAARLCLRYAFLELGMNRVQLHVYAFNEPALRAYEKAGFVREGELRQAVYREGRYFSEYVMAVLRQDWEAGSP